jgi:hypothetical protein
MRKRRKKGADRQTVWVNVRACMFVCTWKLKKKKSDNNPTMREK